MLLEIFQRWRFASGLALKFDKRDAAIGILDVDRYSAAIAVSCGLNISHHRCVVVLLCFEDRLVQGKLFEEMSSGDKVKASIRLASALLHGSGVALRAFVGESFERRLIHIGMGPLSLVGASHVHRAGAVPFRRSARACTRLSPGPAWIGSATWRGVGRTAMSIGWRLTGRSTP